MAGVHIDITTTGMAELLRGLQGLEHSAQHLEPAMREIGEHLLRSHRERWSRAQSPDGQDWKGLSEVTTERKGHSDILRDSDSLRDSLAYQLGEDELEFGSNLKYAATMQFGAKKGEFGRYYQLFRLGYAENDFRRYAGSKIGSPIPWADIPARPFLGISTDDETKILDILSEHLSGPLAP